MDAADAACATPTLGPAPRVGVGVLLCDANDRVLLTLRRRAPEAGCWSILGGKLEPFERLEECAVREAREEAGVEVQLLGLLCVTDHLLPQEGQHWVAPAYLAKAYAGTVQNLEPEKTSDVRWFALDDLPQNLTVTARSALLAYGRCRKVASAGAPPALGGSPWR